MRLFTYKTLTCKCEFLPYNTLHLVSTLVVCTVIYNLVDTFSTTPSSFRFFFGGRFLVDVWLVIFFGGRFLVDIWLVIFFGGHNLNDLFLTD